jgi:hypothetical protein
MEALMRPRFPRWLAVLLLSSCLGGAGCQTWVSGMSLPSGRYLEHPPQYFPPSPAFPLPKELAYQERVWTAPPGGPATPMPGPVDAVKADTNSVGTDVRRNDAEVSNLPRRDPKPSTVVAAGYLFFREAMCSDCSVEKKMALLDQARTSYHQALRLDPNNLPAQMGLARCLLVRNALEEGRPVPAGLTPGPEPVLVLPSPPHGGVVPAPYVETPAPKAPPTPGPVDGVKPVPFTSGPLGNATDAELARPKAPPAASKNAVQIPRSQLDDFTLKVADLAVNNFCLSEIGDLPGSEAKLRLVGSCRNRAAEPRTFCLMVAGLDNARELLWACNVEGRVEAETVEILKENVIPVPAGTLKQTAFVSLRLYASKLPAGPVPARGFPIPARRDTFQPRDTSEPSAATPIPEQPKPTDNKVTAPKEIAPIWHPSIIEAADPTRGGAKNPGLAGRIFLLGADDMPAYYDGELTITVHDASAGVSEKPSAEPVFLYQWTWPSEVLRKLTREDAVGKGYTLFCPFPPGVFKPDMVRLQLQVAFTPTGATGPVTSEPVRLDLKPAANEARPQPGLKETSRSQIPPTR